MRRHTPPGEEGDPKTYEARGLMWLRELEQEPNGEALASSSPDGDPRPFSERSFAERDGWREVGASILLQYDSQTLTLLGSILSHPHSVGVDKDNFYRELWEQAEAMGLTVQKTEELVRNCVEALQRFRQV